MGEPIGRIGLSVCEDFWHPSLPMLQALDGASLLVNVAAGPSRAPGSDAGLQAIEGWHKMQDTYALLGTVALAFCNRVGNEEGLTFWGGSRILAADGSTVVQAPLWEEALVVGTLDSDDLRMQRYALPLVADELAVAQQRDAVAVPMVIGLFDEADRYQHSGRLAANGEEAGIIGRHGDVGNKVLEKVAGERQLGQQGELRPLGGRRANAVGGDLQVRVEVAQAGRHLRQRDAVLHARKRTASGTVPYSRPCVSPPRSPGPRSNNPPSSAGGGTSGPASSPGAVTKAELVLAASAMSWSRRSPGRSSSAQ